MEIRAEIRRQKADQRRLHPISDNNAGATAECREQQTLRQPLANEPSTTRANRQAYGNLLLSLCVSRQKKIGEVRARNQQHDASDAEHQQQRPLHFPAQMRKALVARLELDAARQGAFFVVCVDARSEFIYLSRENLTVKNVEGSLGFGDCDFRFAARHYREPAVPRVL